MLCGFFCVLFLHKTRRFYRNIISAEPLKDRTCARFCATGNFSSQGAQLRHPIDTLQARYDASIVYRDLKAGNLFITKDGGSRSSISAWPSWRGRRVVARGAVWQKWCPQPRWAESSGRWVTFRRKKFAGRVPITVG
jgi:hypothetical protein